VLSFFLRAPEKVFQVPLALITYAGVVFFWFQSGGLEGGSIGVIAIGGLMIMILIPTPPLNIYFSIFYFLTEVALVILESYRPGLFNKEAIQAGLPSLPSTFLIINFFLGGVITFLKALYDRERDGLLATKSLLEKKNKIIEERNETLSRQKEEIEKINAELELRVEQRTRQLRMQKKQLEEFTYLNAHKLRGAITRILGLSSLMKGNPGLEENLPKLIDDSAKEAYKVIQEITIKISEESED
jgi:signal transduction histidine kinase